MASKEKEKRNLKFKVNLKKWKIIFIFKKFNRENKKVNLNKKKKGSFDWRKKGQRCYKERERLEKKVREGEAQIKRGRGC